VKHLESQFQGCSGCHLKGPLLPTWALLRDKQPPRRSTPLHYYNKKKKTVSHTSTCHLFALPTFLSDYWSFCSGVSEHKIHTYPISTVSNFNLNSLILLQRSVYNI
jgi:hypothetical protein